MIRPKEENDPVPASVRGSFSSSLPFSTVWRIITNPRRLSLADHLASRDGLGIFSSPDRALLMLEGNRCPHLLRLSTLERCQCPPIGLFGSAHRFPRFPADHTHSLSVSSRRARLSLSTRQSLDICRRGSERTMYLGEVRENTYQDVPLILKAVSALKCLNPLGRYALVMMEDLGSAGRSGSSSIILGQGGVDVDVADQF